MKAHLTDNGVLIVTTETIPEMSALRRWSKNYYQGDETSKLELEAQGVGGGDRVVYACREGKGEHES